MIIKKITLQNFRCYPYFTVDYSPNLNIIYGPNASGKTTLLEGIYTVAMIKSFRTSASEPLFGGAGSEFSLKGVFDTRNTEKTAILLNSNKTTKIMLNQQPCRTVSEFIGQIPVLVFSPSDSDLVGRGATYRRKFFEPIFCQVDKAYYNSLAKYNKLLIERNSLLKNLGRFRNDPIIVDKETLLLDTIDDELVKLSEIICGKRKEYSSVINSYAAEYYEIISESKEKLKLIYEPSCRVEDMKKILEAYRKDDIRKGSTRFGPHRDDFFFQIDLKDLALYGSQGQRKSALICSRLGCYRFMTEKKGEKPIVLLDDVFSELDKKRQNLLLSLLESDAQIIITTSSISDIDSELIKKSNVIQLFERK